MVADAAALTLGVIGTVSGLFGSAVAYAAYRGHRPKLKLVATPGYEDGVGRLLTVTIENEGGRAVTLIQVGLTTEVPPTRRESVASWFEATLDDSLRKLSRRSRGAPMATIEMIQGYEARIEGGLLLGSGESFTYPFQANAVKDWSAKRVYAYATDIVGRRVGAEVYPEDLGLHRIPEDGASR